MAAVSLVAMTLFPLPLYGRIAAALLLLLGGYGWLRAAYARHREKSDARLLATLAHHRHDWMNDVQVLFGLVRLGKFDKLQPYLDKLKHTLHQESCIARLGNPELAAYLASFRTVRRPFELEVLTEHEIQLERVPLPPETAAALVIGIIECYCEAAVASDGEPSSLSIELAVEENRLLIDYVYDGEYNRELLQDSLDRLLRRTAFSEAELEREWEDERAAMAVRLPYLSMKDTAG
ncbi:hypothetical protein J31TS4_24890 [Paenibacillus sp. J31TS4]|nr:hypothetical protein J31TS4_24890 [Paenibacillus sp. J31TS4]